MAYTSRKDDVEEYGVFGKNGYQVLMTWVEPPMELKVNQKKIKELRLKKSWSQEELAEKAAISLRTVQRMELDGSASLKSRRG